MFNFTEQEEQEMIARSKAGDPEANYNLSLWALERAEEEPEEKRWNSLAARSLVRAAQAGYEPAVQRINALLKKDPAEAPIPEPEPDPEPEQNPVTDPEDEDFDWSAEPEHTDVQARHAAPQPSLPLRAVALVGVAARKTGSFFGDLFTRLRRPGNTAPKEESSAPSGQHSSGSRLPTFLNFSSWDDAQWKKMRLVCSAICVVLAVLIAIMIVSGKKDKTADVEEAQLPVAATAEPVETTPTPSPLPYPDEATIAEIKDTSLDIFPEDDEYVSEATTATVSGGSGLRLRNGPGTSYSQIAFMNYNDTVEVYAESDGWALVKYNGSVWGWCSTDYLKYK